MFDQIVCGQMIVMIVVFVRLMLLLLIIQKKFVHNLCIFQKRIDAVGIVDKLAVVLDGPLGRIGQYAIELDLTVDA